MCAAQHRAELLLMQQTFDCVWFFVTTAALPMGHPEYCYVVKFSFVYSIMSWEGEPVRLLARFF